MWSEGLNPYLQTLQLVLWPADCPASPQWIPAGHSITDHKLQPHAHNSLMPAQAPGLFQTCPPPPHPKHSVSEDAAVCGHLDVISPRDLEPRLTSLSSSTPALNTGQGLWISPLGCIWGISSVCPPLQFYRTALVQPQVCLVTNSFNSPLICFTFHGLIFKSKHSHIADPKLPEVGVSCSRSFV